MNQHANLHRTGHGTAHRAGQPNPWWSVLGIVAFLGGIILAWIGAFYASEALYGPLGLHPSPLVRQVVTSLLGVILLAIPSMIVTTQPCKVGSGQIAADAVG